MKIIFLNISNCNRQEENYGAYYLFILQHTLSKHRLCSNDIAAYRMYI